MSNETRKLILARRARFIAAAMAGLGTASCDDVLPRPCLEPPRVQDTDPRAEQPDAAPQPCLEPMPDDTLYAPDAGAGDAAAAGADGRPPRPRPCLGMAPPRACLTK